MPQDDPKTLVSTDWLAAHLKDPDLRILDASWYLPHSGRDARAEYEGTHIPGARFFDIEEISDARSDQPHMAPPVEKFMSRMRALGVGDGHQVVVYDGTGIFSAPRVWWLFKLMGHRDVAVLDGGIPAWTGKPPKAQAKPGDAQFPPPPAPAGARGAACGGGGATGPAGGCRGKEPAAAPSCMRKSAPPRGDTSIVAVLATRPPA